MDKQTKYTTKCTITAPVMSGKEPIGVVMALNKQGASEFSKSDQEVSGQCCLDHWAAGFNHSRLTQYEDHNVILTHNVK